MKQVVTVILDTLKVFLLFVICTILFYLGLQWLDQNYKSFHKYEEPDDGAVKVFNPEGESGPVDRDGFHRLFQFLRNGE